MATIAFVYSCLAILWVLISFVIIRRRAWLAAGTLIGTRGFIQILFSVFIPFGVVISLCVIGSIRYLFFGAGKQEFVLAAVIPSAIWFVYFLYLNIRSYINRKKDKSEQQRLWSKRQECLDWVNQFDIPSTAKIDVRNFYFRRGEPCVNLVLKRISEELEQTILSQIDHAPEGLLLDILNDKTMARIDAELHPKEKI